MISGSMLAYNHYISGKRGYRFADERARAKELAIGFVRALPALLMPVIILGGIHLGVFTPTEASAAAVFYALVVGRFVYRTLRMRMLPAILYRTAILSSSILMIIAGSEIFAWVLTVGQLPQQVAQWMAGFGLPPLALFLLINVFLLLAGIFIEPLPGVMIFAPILAPIALAAGINPLQFGIVTIINLTIGMITPPVGALLFVTSVVTGVPMDKMNRDLLPMLGVLVAVLLLLVLFPSLITWLPGAFGYTR
jgi:tripartite ATP-independent transporter DctM subunit